MKGGQIKFYNHQGGYGYIQTSDFIDVYFHASEVKSELKTLLNANKYKNEPIIFDIVDSTRKDGEYEGRNINIDLNERMVGYTEVSSGRYNQEVYHIINFYTQERYFLHHSNLRKDGSQRFISIDDNEPVVFSPDTSEKGLLALDVVLIDSKSYIESFADFTDYQLALQDLADNICEKEDWDYIENKRNGIPILRSYINQTAKRLVAQNKIVIGISSYGDEYAHFNTGLVDEYQNEVYAFFEKNRRFNENQPWGIVVPKWRFAEFNTDQSKYFKYFSEPAEIATYFEDTQVNRLVFDTTLTIRPNWEHLLSRQHRIDSSEIKLMTEQDFRDAIEDSINMAKKRIRRNYKTAIPHFYSGEIQFLVPLCERKNRGKAIAAMVINKQEQIYVISTILTLDQAYNNARLLAKPDREWLNP